MYGVCRTGVKDCGPTYSEGKGGTPLPTRRWRSRAKAADHLLAFRPDPFEPPDAIQAADELELE